MTTIQAKIKSRYDGVQDKLIACGEGGCHFLMCCSIIEEVNHKPLDLLEAINYAHHNKLFKQDFEGINCIPFLNHFTGKTWTRSELIKHLPADIKENQFTEVKYHNNRTKYDHFTRRYVDPKKDSKTVAEGFIEGYYIYTYV